MFSALSALEKATLFFLSCLLATSAADHSVTLMVSPEIAANSQLMNQV
jgi:hypothetical protein